MKKIAWMVVGLFLAGVAAQAATIVEDNWDTAGLQGWGATNAFPPAGGHTAPPYATSIANAGGTLQITGGAANPGVPQDLIFDTDNLGGGRNFTTSGVQAVQFDFYAAQQPSGLSVYLMSTNNYVWYYDITPVATGWGLGYFANITAPGWYSPNGGTDFYADLGGIDEVGILLRYAPNIAGQVYALDNFMLLDEPVPEPETYALIGAVLLSLAITFRDKLRAPLAWAAIRAKF